MVGEASVFILESKLYVLVGKEIKVFLNVC